METGAAYDQWSGQYDTNRNRTRDLEAQALREVLEGPHVERCLEIGCGTGKNTEWLATRCGHVTAVDLSAGMLAIARKKVPAPHVTFHQADILRPWDFVEGDYDLVTFSLVLEHIEGLGPIMRKAADALKPGGRIYIGELHPYKQYSGTKARFDTEDGTRVVECFQHHLSDFTNAAAHARLGLQDMREFFDADDTCAPPRIIVLLLSK